MIINIEGIDKAGKSSLARHLSERFNLPIVKFSAPKGDPYIEYMKFLINNDKPCILDRFYLGELVYGPIKRHKCGLNSWQIRNLEMLMAMRNSFNIYVNVDRNIVESNFIKDKEEYLSISEIPAILNQYSKVLKTSELKWVEFNYSRDHSYNVIDYMIEKWINSFSLPIVKSMIDTRAIGGFNSRTLILGETSNIHKERPEYVDINVPFANGPSSNVLYDSLYSFKVPLTNIAISNVVKCHSQIKETYLPELLLPYLEKVICLGEVANSLYFRMENKPNIPKVRIPHPSYVARGYMPKHEYIKLLEKEILW